MEIFKAVNKAFDFKGLNWTDWTNKTNWANLTNKTNLSNNPHTPAAVWAVGVWAVLAMVAGPSAMAAGPGQAEAARGVIERFAGGKVPVSVAVEGEARDGLHSYRVIPGADSVGISATGGVAACRAFYDYVRRNGLGIASWSGNRLDWPAKLAPAEPWSVTSPFKHHYYMNVVTFGYAAPYWDWARWEREIDWMALHGIDMPLALVANEAITARVFSRLGLSDAEVDAYFTAPGHFPWMRMGNLSGIDGPLPRSWHDSQVALQHKILDRMRSLGMKPICPAFAGFVPQSFKTHFPDAPVTETTWLGGFHNWMLQPGSPLFRRIGKMFVEEWEREFGKCDYYIADSFNEMEAVFPPKGTKERHDMLAGFGREVYGSIADANPDAVWVMQGWMFGYMRDIWDYETLQALVSEVPDDRLLLLDLAVDYNKCFWKINYNWEFYKGFFNKEWVYSVIPNMGGKNTLSGIPEFYANGRFAALDSPNRGRLAGYGMAPEGLENNEVLYELITDAGWTHDSIDVASWHRNYATCRYGATTNKVESAWRNMGRSVYSTLVDNPRYNWQFRPGTVFRGNVRTDDSFDLAALDLAAAADSIDTPLFRADLLEVAANVAFSRLEVLARDWESAFSNNDTASATAIERQFADIALDADRLLASHPTLRLGPWLDYARKSGGDAQQSDYYERNARRLVTMWGGSPVDDYAARLWSGLIRDYYLPRWQTYFANKRGDVAYDPAAWERVWVEQKHGVSDVTPYADPVAAARALIGKSLAVKERYADPEGVRRLGGWSPSDMRDGGTGKFVWNLSVDDARALQTLTFATTRGDGRLTVSDLVLEMDGKKYPPLTAPEVADGNIVFAFEVPATATGNNACRLTATLATDAPTHGKVTMTRR